MGFPGLKQQALPVVAGGAGEGQHKLRLASEQIGLGLEVGVAIEHIAALLQIQLQGERQAIGTERCLLTSEGRLVAEVD